MICSIDEQKYVIDADLFHAETDGARQDSRCVQNRVSEFENNGYPQAGSSRHGELILRSENQSGDLATF